MLEADLDLESAAILSHLAVAEPGSPMLVCRRCGSRADAQRLQNSLFELCPDATEEERDRYMRALASRVPDA